MGGAGSDLLGASAPDLGEVPRLMQLRIPHGGAGLEPEEMVGFSAFLSIGSDGGRPMGDLIDYLGYDPRTSVRLDLKQGLISFQSADML